MILEREKELGRSTLLCCAQGFMVGILDGHSLSKIQAVSCEVVHLSLLREIKALTW